VWKILTSAIKFWTVLLLHLLNIKCKYKKKKKTNREEFPETAIGERIIFLNTKCATRVIQRVICGVKLFLS